MAATGAVLWFFFLACLYQFIIKEMEIIGTALYKLFPGDSNSNKILRGLTAFSFMSIILWTIILFFSNSPDDKLS